MNTIEEKSEKAWLDYEYRADGNLYSTCFRDGYIQGATEALSHQWISVEDALPEDENDVVVIYSEIYSNIKCAGIASYDVDDCQWYSSDDIVNESKRFISHWMPIPPLPEARKDERV